MKKLLFWAVLLMTGFAFYSCDERYDNPATETPNPSDPASTWTYEVNVKFAEFVTYDGEEQLKFEAPNTLYVFNKSLDLLGEITCDEEIDQDNYSADFYKFAGTLKGAIGDTLVIGTIGDQKWFAEKQDGTIETIYKNGILQTAKVPIIVANESNGKIGTQRVELKNHTAIVAFNMYRYATGKETGVTISCKDFMMPKTEDINITFAKDVDPCERFWVAIPLLDDSKSNYEFKTTTEKGVDLYGYLFNYWSFKPNKIYYQYYTLGVEMLPKEIDLTEFKELFNTNWVDIHADGTVVTQSGDDAIDFNLYFYTNKATIKGININGELYCNTPDGETECILNIEGDNTVSSTYNYAVLWIYRKTTFKGNGTLSINNNNTWNYGYGIYITSYEENYIDDKNSIVIPSGLIIEDGVTVKAKAPYGGIYIEKLTGDYEYNVDGKREKAEWTDLYNNFVEVNGNLETEGDYNAIYKRGIINIGETGSLKATSNNASWKIYDASITEGEDYEAKLETLVADKSKFSDEISEDKKVRTIKKK